MACVHPLPPPLPPSSNILLRADGAVKFADFGLGRGGDASTYVGTLRYMSPERARGQREPYGPPADVWGLGLCLLEGALGAYPYAAQLGGDASQLAVVLAVTDSEPSPPPVATTSPAFSAFLAAALAREPGERATAAALLDDAWFEQHGVSSLDTARALVRAWLQGGAAGAVAAGSSVRQTSP